MIGAGLWLPRAQRRQRPHPPRYRRPCLGELVQIDGCDHEWFEQRGPRCVLLVFVDDATGQIMHLRFVASESTFDYFAAVRRYVEQHGKPVAFYSDKASIFRVNAQAPRCGPNATQFARAMGELNIDVLCANSPQAKGRVERTHQTLQDRLAKELRLRGIDNPEDANRFAPEFIEDYKRRFGRDPADPARRSPSASRGRGPRPGVAVEGAADPHAQPDRALQAAPVHRRRLAPGPGRARQGR
jgi:hypothetical protein